MGIKICQMSVAGSKRTKGHKPRDGPVGKNFNLYGITRIQVKNGVPLKAGMIVLAMATFCSPQEVSARCRKLMQQ